MNGPPRSGDTGRTLTRLVFAASRPPFPLTYGTGIRSHRLLSGLAGAFDVTLVTQDSVEDDGTVLDRTELERRLPGVTVVTVAPSTSGKRRAQARSLLSSCSHQWGRALEPSYAGALRRTAAGARIVHFEDLGAASFGPVSSALSTFAPHNVEHRILKGTAETEGGVRGAFAQIEWRKILREEQRAWRSMDLCLAVSEVDAAVLRASGAARVESCPNGTDVRERLPLRQRSSTDPLRLVFVGTANYLPYERGVEWLVREVLPRVRECGPVELRVVGSPPMRPIVAEGVRYVGRVPSVKPFYEEADVAVVPVFTGSGTRMKIIEAMAHGRPVVSTPLGAEGLPIEAPLHFDMAADPASFAAALTALGSLPRSDEAQERRLARAYEAARSLFWPSVVDRLVELYRTELDHRPAP